MPIIHVELLKDRPPEARQALDEALTQAAVSTLNVAPEAVRVLLVEVEPDHWFAGGRPIARPAPVPAVEVDPHA